MQFTPSALRKIGIVYGLLIVLLVIALFVRFWRGNSMKSTIGQNNSSNSVSNNASYPGTYSLKTDATAYKVGEKIDVAAYFEAAGKELDGSDVVLYFDPAVFAASQIVPGTYFKLMPRKEMDDKNGIVKITALDSGGNASLSAKTLFGVISFTAKKPGNAKIDFDFTQGGTNKTTLIEHKTSKNILGSVVGITINVTQ